MIKKSKRDWILWLDEPAENNYPSALSYLSLIFTDREAAELVFKLKTAPLSAFKSRDIFRASGLPLLGLSQHQIEKNFKKIKLNEKLSPVLLVRDKERGKVIVADGYHRICAVYHYNDNIIIPCKIV